MPDLAQFKASLDIVSLAAEFGEVTRSGSTAKMRCMFHDERTPSMYLYPSNNTFHCFGCGQHGDVIDVVAQGTGLSFREALDWIAERTGVEPPSRDPRQAVFNRGVRDLLAELTEARRSAGDPPFGLPEDMATRLGVGLADDLVAYRAAHPDCPLTEHECETWQGRITVALMRRGVTIGLGSFDATGSFEMARFSRAAGLVGLADARVAAREHGGMLVTPDPAECLRLHAAGESSVVSPGRWITRDDADELRTLVPRTMLLLTRERARDPRVLESIWALLGAGLRVEIARLSDGLTIVPAGSAYQFLVRLAPRLTAGDRNTLWRNFLAALPSLTTRTLFTTHLQRSGEIGGNILDA